MCDFEKEEIQRESSRIEEVFQRLELEPRDIDPAMQWVRQNHDVELARRLTNSSASRRIMVEAPKAFAILNQEVKQRIANCIGVVERGAPRAMISVAHFPIRVSCV